MKKYKTHYDAIPSDLLHGTVLDVGCGDLENQMKSKNWAFLSTNSIGIDIEYGTDLFEYQTEERFDTVLAIHIIEHIEIERWPELFERLKSFVRPGGWLVIGTPYRQSSYVYRNFQGPENQRHRVFSIDENMLERYLDGDIWVYKYRGPFSMSLMVMWRKDI